MENKTCKTCRYNDNLLCDRKGIWIQDDDTLEGIHAGKVFKDKVRQK